MLKSLLLTLKGVIRSWGVTSIGDDRSTSLFPTASAILGLTGACIGVNRHDPEQIKAWYTGFDIVTLSATSFSMRHNGYLRSINPQLFWDFQTTRNSLSMSGEIRSGTVRSKREYISNGLDVAAIIPRHEEAETWILQLLFAIQQPCFIPFLGRISNPLSAPIVEPGENITQTENHDQIFEYLYNRLTNIPLGKLLPNHCSLRMPSHLSDQFLNKDGQWHFDGKHLINDHRSGFFRSYETRYVNCYNRVIRTGASK